MKFAILNRWTDATQFECELAASYENESYGVKLGAAINIAIKARADLTDADLTDADLTRANLTDADLTDADLTPIRDDFWAVLSSAPKEVLGLRLALVEGRVDGSTYSGDCACLLGTIANVRGVGYQSLGTITPNSSRPVERFFLSIRKGDKPETNQFSARALDWLDQWVDGVKSAFGGAL